MLGIIAVPGDQAMCSDGTTSQGASQITNMKKGREDMQIAFEIDSIASG